MNKTLLFASIILLIPLVSAQFYYGYGYFNPSDLLDNQWFIFTVFFTVFFGVIYSSLGRVLGGAAPTLAISAALGFLMAAGVQRNWYFLEQPIMIWAVLLISALIISIFLKFLFGGNSKEGIVITLCFLVIVWGLWPFIKGFLPLETIANIPYSMLEFMDSTWFLALIAGIACLIFFGKRSWIKMQASFKTENWKGQLK